MSKSSTVRRKQKHLTDLKIGQANIQTDTSIEIQFISLYER